VKAVRFHDAARAELASEALHYATISPRLGERLVAAVEQASMLASQFPAMGSPYKYGTRRVFPNKFPFSLVYVDRSNEVYVLALAPFSRKPAYWRGRKNDGEPTT
jgi:toxin ParE1/3/4